jgi:aerobic-type carbon monoxide dehydrogenase small subunit (CoxS/CutS family)
MNRNRHDQTPRPLKIIFSLNESPVEIEVKPWETALAVLREQLGLTGTKEGCGIGECGACTILVDGLAVDSCLMPAPKLDGTRVETVEGLRQGELLHPIQEAFLSKGAVQCGYCTPGMLMSAKALLDKNPNPQRDEVVETLSGNLCRCTGYVQILEAVEEAAKTLGKNNSRS